MGILSDMKLSSLAINPSGLSSGFADLAKAKTIKHFMLRYTSRKIMQTPADIAVVNDMNLEEFYIRVDNPICKLPYRNLFSSVAFNRIPTVGIIAYNPYDKSPYKSAGAESAITTLVAQSDKKNRQPDMSTRNSVETFTKNLVLLDNRLSDATAVSIADAIRREDLRLDRLTILMDGGIDRSRVAFWESLPNTSVVIHGIWALMGGQPGMTRSLSTLTVDARLRGNPE